MRTVRTSVDGETYLHKMLWRVVARQIEHASTNPDGSFYDDLVAMVFASHTLEAYLNFVGERLDPAFWKDERRHFRATGFDGKVRKVLELCQIEEPNRTDRPYHTVWKLKELRDRIAHAKPERFSATTVHSADVEPDLYGTPLDGLVTHQQACEAAEDVKKFIAMIHSAAKRRVSDVGFGTDALSGILQHSTGILS
jgi:hypothetical protein